MAIQCLKYNSIEYLFALKAGAVAGAHRKIRALATAIVDQKQNCYNTASHTIAIQITIRR